MIDELSIPRVWTVTVSLLRVFGAEFVEFPSWLQVSHGWEAIGVSVFWMTADTPVLLGHLVSGYSAWSTAVRGRCHICQGRGRWRRVASVAFGQTHWHSTRGESVCFLDVCALTGRMWLMNIRLTVDRHGRVWQINTVRPHSLCIVCVCVERVLPMGTPVCPVLARPLWWCVNPAINLYTAQPKQEAVRQQITQANQLDHHMDPVNHDSLARCEPTWCHPECTLGMLSPLIPFVAPYSGSFQMCIKSKHVCAVTPPTYARLSVPRY